MVFKRFVEVGRVIIVNYGPLVGKLAVIVDVLTTTKVLVQGLKGGIKRQELSLRRVTLTDYKLDIKRGAKTQEVYKALDDYKLEEKFKKSSIAKKCEQRQKRAVLRHTATKGVKKPKAQKAKKK